MSQKPPHTPAEQILRYLDEHGVVDKDKGRSGHAGGGQRGVKRQHKHETLDLHGLTEEQADSAVTTVVQRCRAQGVRTLLIIHGRGYHSDPLEGPVLKRLVVRLLEYPLRECIREFRPAPPDKGGEGATVVYF
jgi:DNA-nicking Smr family endonuclease